MRHNTRQKFMFDFVRHTRSPVRRAMRLQRERGTRGMVLTRWIAGNGRILGAVGILLISLFLGTVILQGRSLWNGRGQHGFLVIFGEDDNLIRSMSIVIVDGEEQAATIVPLPETLLVETVQGYGLYKSSSLYGLAQLERMPVSFLTQSITLQFGIDVRSVVWIEENNTSLSSTRLAKEFLGGIALQNKSTFGVMDRYRLWQFFSGLRKDQLSTLDLLSSSVIQPFEEGNAGEALFRLDPVRLDPLVFQLLSDSRLRKEGLAVAIVNTTQEPRLGTRVARAFSNMGIDVVSVSTGTELTKETSLLGATDETLETKAAEAILATLHVPKKQARKNAEKTLEHRADLVLMIGEDLGSLFSGTQE